MLSLSLLGMEQLLQMSIAVLGILLLKPHLSTAPQRPGLDLDIFHILAYPALPRMVQDQNSVFFPLSIKSHSLITQKKWEASKTSWDKAISNPYHQALNEDWKSHKDSERPTGITARDGHHLGNWNPKLHSHPWMAHAFQVTEQPSQQITHEHTYGIFLPTKLMTYPYTYYYLAF